MNIKNNSAINVLAPVQLNRLWGFIDTTGKIIIEPNFLLPKGYREDNPFTSGIAIVKSYPDGLYGAISPSGSWIVPPVYKGLTDFEEGLALIVKDSPRVNEDIPDTGTSKPFLPDLRNAGNTIFIDISGNHIIFDSFDDVSPFREGLAVARKGSMYGYIDKKGKIAIPFIFFDAGDFFHNLARVDAGSKLDSRGDRISRYGFINKKGEWAIEPEFDFAFSFYSDFCIVEKDEKQGVIDESGALVIPYAFVFPVHWNQFKGGVAFAQDYDAYEKGMDKTGLLNLQGEWIVKPVFDEVREFNEGLAAVRVKKKWGYIDHAGRWIVEPYYDWADTFKDDYAPVKSEGKYGYINKQGHEAIPFKFEDADWFSYGLAAVKVNGRYGYINKKGEFDIQPYFEKAGMFHDANS